MSQIILTTQSSASIATPSSGKVSFFVDSADGLLKYKDDTGSVIVPGTQSYSLVETTSASYTIVAEDAVLLNPSTTGAVTLPTAVGRTRPLYLMNKSNNLISITGTINGSSSNEFLAGNPFAGLVLIPINGGWYVF